MLIEIPNNYFRQLNKAIGQILILQPEMQVTWQKKKINKSLKFFIFSLYLAAVNIFNQIS